MVWSFLNPASGRRSLCTVVPRACLLAAVMLGGCASSHGPGVTEKTLTASPIVSAQQVTLTPDELRAVVDDDATGPYVLGPGDVIQVSVYLHPELSEDAGADLTAPVTSDASGTAPTTNGVRNVMITSDGTVQLPLLGTIKFGGYSLTHIQHWLTHAYARYIKDPQVAVNLVSARSMSYYLLGDFAQPGIKYPQHPLSLLQALALGGSVDLATADLYQAYVAHGNTKLPIDMYTLMVNGDLSQNITLASGDVIMVPTSANEDAFVFGTVAKPGAVPFAGGHLSLLQALAGAGVDLPSLTTASLANVHIIRSSGASAQFYVVNAQMILNGQSAGFDLQPGDVVFVPPNPVAQWNEIMNELLPSLQMVSAGLSPFVSIKYLSQ
jgi:polysaccharide export outer membrane protein